MTINGLYSYGWFLWEVAVCSYTSQNVDYEIAKASMSRMLNLRNVLQLVIHSLYYSPLPEKQFVGYGHQCSLHVAIKFSMGYFSSNSRYISTFVPNLNLEQILY